MKILWVSEVDPDPNSGAGGTELLMVRQLRNLGHEVQTIWADELPRRIAHGNLHYALELPGTYAKAILAASRRTSFDIVTVNLGQSFLAGRKLRSRGFEGAFIVRSHGLDDHLEEVLSKWSRILGLAAHSSIKSKLSKCLVSVTGQHIHKASKVCDGYVVSNSLDAQFLHQRHRLAWEQIATIPQAPAAVFRANHVSQMTPHRLRKMLYVAGYHFAKGPHAVATAAKQLLSADENLSLTWICHPGDHAKVKNLLGPVAPRVRLLGWMTQEELVKEFDGHGVFLYPSLFDGFGKIFLEAMSRGLCVIGTTAGGMVDIIQHGLNGFLCDFNAPQQIVDRVVEIQRDLQAAGKMSSAAVKTADQHTWERVGRELEQFFAERLKSVSNDKRATRAR